MPVSSSLQDVLTLTILYSLKQALGPPKGVHEKSVSAVAS